MKRHFTRFLKKVPALCLALSLLPAFLPVPAAASAPVGYLPGVTEEMAEPAYWSGRTSDPDALLASPEEIGRINALSLAAEGSNMHDLKNLPETYNGTALNESLLKGAADDAEYLLGWTWDRNGVKFTQEYFDAIMANCVDPDAAEKMPLRYGIAVSRTVLRVYPWDGQILDDPADIDFDYQPLVGVRVNEPLAVFSTSADGKYYYAHSSCCSGWVRAEDVALCRDREEWLGAWDLPAEKRLVFWGDKMYTDYSASAPETSCRLITLGTVLERMDASDPEALTINRLPLHNYCVYLPVRNGDGSYGKTPALINARERVSEDYLPLTPANLAKVALASLGDAYGWGAGLNNEDCTSLLRQVFCCFGLDLPRNGTGQWPLPVAKADVAFYTLEEKEALVDALPLGTLLNFPGHQMMYLGKDADEYFVVSASSSMMSPWSGLRQRTRGVHISTLNTKRANGKTWMQSLNKICVPWISRTEEDPQDLSALPPYHEYTAFCLEHELVDPFPTGYFVPERAATTAEAVEMLWRVAGKPEPAPAEEAGEQFPDVAAGSAHEKAALWARQTGVYPGVDGEFRGNAVLTGDALAAMAKRLLNEELPDAGALRADDSVTRAELAKAARSVYEIWAVQHPAEEEGEK